MTLALGGDEDRSFLRAGRVSQSKLLGTFQASERTYLKNRMGLEDAQRMTLGVKLASDLCTQVQLHAHSQRDTYM